MPDRGHNDQSKEGGILNKLIRAARQAEGGGFIRPDDDAIVAYLMGTATPEQGRLMRSALSRSEAFRREVLWLAKDMEDLEREPAVDTAAPVVTRAPSRHEFLRRYGVAPPRAREVLALPAKLRRIWDTSAHRVVTSAAALARPSRKRITRVYIPAAAIAAAALVVLFTMRIALFGPGTRGPGTARLLLVQNLVPPEELIEIGAVRGHPAGLEEAYACPEEAAKAVFRGLLKRRGPEFIFVPEEDRPKQRPLAEPLRQLVLRFVNDRGMDLAESTAQVPLARGARPRYEAYMLTLPATALYKTALTADTTSLAWPDSLGVRGCIAFTYPCQGGYCAAGGDTFRLR